jgi:hypothetical protein
LKTIAFPVKKKLHRFIVGPKGQHLSDIFKKTGCYILIPPSASELENITIRGPDHMLTVALQMVLEKANSVILADVDIKQFVPSTFNIGLYTKYLFNRLRNELKEIEARHGVSVSRSPQNNLILEVQGNNTPDTNAGIESLSKLVKEHGSGLYFAELNVPKQLHRFLIGKGGQNIVKLKAKPEFQNRLLDLCNDDSDDMFVVIRRLEFHDDAGRLHSEMEIKDFYAQVSQALLDNVKGFENLRVVTVPIENKYHGRIIGSGGLMIKDIMGPRLHEAVLLKFPTATSPVYDNEGKAIPLNSILIRGPKEDVAEATEKLNSIVSDWKKVENLVNTSTLTLQSGVLPKLFSNSQPGFIPVSAFAWVISEVRKALTKLPKVQAALDKEDVSSSHMHIRIEVLKSSDEEKVINVTAPKSILSLVLTTIKEKAEYIANRVTDSFCVFDIPAVLEVLPDCDGAKERIMGRSIGKDGKRLKALIEKHNVIIKGNEDVDAGESKGSGVMKIIGAEADVRNCKAELLDIVKAEVCYLFLLTL